MLEEAEQGAECQVEAQELHRLEGLEEELVRELVCVDEAPAIGNFRGDTGPAERVCSMAGDVGGGCEASVETEAGAPLQTKIISVEDVLKDIESWWDPMVAEYQALVCEKQVAKPVTAQELSRREAAGEVFQIIPAKLIFTLKAFTARRKVRCVGCGNYLGDGMYSANQLYAGGLDVVSLRCCLALMVARQWSAGAVDIKTAFLNAELEKEDQRNKKGGDPRARVMAPLRDLRRDLLGRSSGALWLANKPSGMGEMQRSDVAKS